MALDGGQLDAGGAAQAIEFEIVLVNVIRRPAHGFMLHIGTRAKVMAESCALRACILSVNDLENGEIDRGER